MCTNLRCRGCSGPTRDTWSSSLPGSSVGRSCRETAAAFELRAASCSSTDSQRLSSLSREGLEPDRSLIAASFLCRRFAAVPSARDCARSLCPLPLSSRKQGRPRARSVSSSLCSTTHDTHSSVDSALSSLSIATDRCTTCSWSDLLSSPSLPQPSVPSALMRPLHPLALLLFFGLALVCACCACVQLVAGGAASASASWSRDATGSHDDRRSDTRMDRRELLEHSPALEHSLQLDDRDSDSHPLARSPWEAGHDPRVLDSPAESTIRASVPSSHPRMLEVSGRFHRASGQWNLSEYSTPDTRNCSGCCRSTGTRQSTGRTTQRAAHGIAG